MNTAPARSPQVQPTGLIGLGRVGMAFAHRLLSSSQPVLGYRRSPATDLLDAGGMLAASVASVATTCHTIVLSLPQPAASASVLDELLRHARGTVTIIDTTSMPPASSRELGSKVQARGHIYLEAPVNGTPELVRNHQATLLVGGELAGLQGVRPVLELLAARVVHAGPWGAGSALKSAALMMMAINTVGVAEALAYAVAHDVDPTVAIQAWQQGPAASTALQQRGPLMAQRQYPPRLGTLGGVRGMLASAAAASPVHLPLLRNVLANLGQASDAGLSDMDLAAVHEYINPAGQAQ